jgi:hypothetical protein
VRDEEVGRVRVRMNADAWAVMHAAGADPATELGRRGLGVLAGDYGCDQGELNFIATDPRYQESCRTEYAAAKRLFDRKARLPRKITLYFDRPGTRKPNMKEKPPEDE